MENVEPAGWASLAGLRQGDLVLKINGENMSEVELFEKKMDQWIKEKENELFSLLKEGSIPFSLSLNLIGITPRNPKPEVLPI